MNRRVILSVAEELEQDNSMDYSKTPVEVDYKQLQSFEDMLVSSIHAAEETLATAKSRHAIFSRMLNRIENKNGLDG